MKPVPVPQRLGTAAVADLPSLASCGKSLASREPGPAARREGAPEPQPGSNEGPGRGRRPPLPAPRPRGHLCPGDTGLSGNLLLGPQSEQTRPRPASRRFPPKARLAAARPRARPQVTRTGRAQHAPRAPNPRGPHMRATNRSLEGAARCGAGAALPGGPLPPGVPGTVSPAGHLGGRTRAATMATQDAGPAPPSRPPAPRRPRPGLG